eukprot:2092859-Prymnesium_polylepis.1
MSVALHVRELESLPGFAGAQAGGPNLERRGSVPRAMPGNNSPDLTHFHKGCGPEKVGVQDHVSVGCLELIERIQNCAYDL